MLKKTVSFLWSLRRQFIKYFIVGISAVVIDMGTLVFLKEFLGINPVPSVIANQIIVMSFVFTTNKYWSFRSLIYSHRQVARYAIVASFDYFFAICAMYVFNGLLDFDYRLVRLASIAAAVSWNFFLYKYWVYAQNELISPLQKFSEQKNQNIREKTENFSLKE
jgi:putative flippase GtrA